MSQELDAISWINMSQQQSLGYQNAISADKRTRNPNWTDGEISRFLEILLEEPVLRDLKEQRNRQVFCYVSQKMFHEGSEKTWDQCKIKLKNLKSQWRYVRDRVPNLDMADLEDEDNLKEVMRECQDNGVSPFCVKHLRLLKRFLDSLAMIKKGFPLPLYAPLDTTPMPYSPRTTNNQRLGGMDPLAGGAESALLAPEVDIVEETTIKLEHDPDHSNDASEPLVVDFPGDPSPEKASSRTSSSDIQATAAKPITANLPTLTPAPPAFLTLKGSSVSITPALKLTDSDSTITKSEEKQVLESSTQSLWVKSPNLINSSSSISFRPQGGVVVPRSILSTSISPPTASSPNSSSPHAGSTIKRRWSSSDQNSESSTKMRRLDATRTDRLSVEAMERSSLEAGETAGVDTGARTLNNAIQIAEPGVPGNSNGGLDAMTRLQGELTDKFLAFQRQSEIRHLNWERDQRRAEASMLERWRLEQRELQDRWRSEQRQLQERWREEQRSHDKELLSMFTNFITNTVTIMNNRS